MITFKTIIRFAAIAIIFAAALSRGEEQFAVTNLSRTTLTGFVDTSVTWWTGSSSGGSDLPIRKMVPTFEPWSSSSVIFEPTPWSADAFRQRLPVIPFTTLQFLRPGSSTLMTQRVLSIARRLPRPVPSTLEQVTPPRVKVRLDQGAVVAELVGAPGQTCAISFSSDLANWSAPEVVTLQTGSQVLQSPEATSAACFYRVTQSLPVTSAPSAPVEASP